MRKIFKTGAILWENRPQQKMQLFGHSEGLPAIRAKSSYQKTLIPISPKILEHPIIYIYPRSVKSLKWYFSKARYGFRLEPQPVKYRSKLNRLVQELPICPMI